MPLAIAHTAPPADEPFYAFSLVNHGNDHPMRDEIIAANESDWDALVAKCTKPSAMPVFYQNIAKTYHAPIVIHNPSRLACPDWVRLTIPFRPGAPVR